MQAVRLARYHTRRNYLVRFCGAYHGWWGDVQPGVGNPLAARETYTLKDMDEATLHVLRTRRDIACVLVNPLQALHPNAERAGRFGAGRQRTQRAFRPRGLHRMAGKAARRVHRARHRADLRRGLRRLSAWRRAARRSTSACAPTWSPTARRWAAACRSAWSAVARDLMKRFREDRPADICFARGTFNSHPYVMGAMHEFLQRLESEPIRAIYRDLDQRWNRRARSSTSACARPGCPCKWHISRPSGPSTTRSRRATTGCSSTTCAPQAWP